jgi:hypothetical protein
VTDGSAPPDKPDPRRQLVLDEARRAIDQQIRDLDGVRSRASSLVALTIAGGTFLAGVMVNQGIQPNCGAISGLLLLGAAALLALNTLRPYSFTFNLKIVDFDQRSFQDDADTLVRAAALSLAEDARDNRAMLDRLFTQYLVALALLVLGLATIAISIIWR